METRKKPRLFLTTATIILAAVLLFPFLGNANPDKPVSVAAAPASNSLFLPLVMNNYPLPVVQTTYGAEMFQINSAGGLNQMAATNESWTRRNAVIWSSIETTDPNGGTPSFNWSAMADLETELTNASSRGIQVILIVRSTPGWARKDGNIAAGPSCGPIAQNKMAEFGKFMKALVARYSLAPYNIKYWEMWNEEDAPYKSGDDLWGCWGDSTDTYNGGGYYEKMLQAAYPQIKSADSQAQVLLGGLLLDCDPRKVGTGGCATSQAAIPPKFLEGVLKNGGGPYFDGVSFHGYDFYDWVDWSGNFGQYGNGGWQSTWNTTGPVTLAKADFIKNILSKYSVTGKFLMNTEVALVCGDGNGNVPPQYQDYCHKPDFETTKAYYLAETYAAGIMEGLRANTWYAVLGWRDSQLLNPDLSTTQAYTAFQFSRSELRNSTYLNAVSKSDVGNVSNVKGYKFQRGDRRIWILWSLDGSPHTINLSGKGTPLAAWDALGAYVTPSISMSVTLKPLYLEWNP